MFFQSRERERMELLAQWPLLWIPSTLALLYILTRARARDPRHGDGRLPPGPKPLPIVGNLLELRDMPHRALARLARTYGPLMALKLGQVDTVVVTSPEMAREVLQKRDQSFSSRPVPDVSRVFGHCERSVVMLPAGQTWRNLRRICSTKLFTSQRINENQGLMQNKARELVKYVRECCLAGEAVDIGRATYTTVLNMISNTFFSIDLGDNTNSESAKNFRDLVRKIMVETGSPNLSDYFPVLAAIDLQGRRRRNADNVGKLYNFFDELIDQRMQAKEGRVSDAAPTDDFLDSLIHCYTLDSDLKVDRRAMKSLLLDLFLGGTDTSTVTIEWMMTELLRNPNSMEKARHELIKIIGNKKEVDMSDIHQLHYLQAIVKETLRLHPPGPLLPHKAETSVELFGYTISEGSQVLVNVWAIGRDGDVWTDPESFIPERFLGRDIDYKGQDFEFIPFGSGRRICPGLPLAFQMVHLILASLLLPFKWKLPNGMEPVDVNMDEKFGITLAKAIPLCAIPILDTL